MLGELAETCFAFPQVRFSPSAQDRGPGAFGYFLHQRRFIVTPVTGLNLVDEERRNQAAVSNERCDDGGPLVGTEKRGRNPLVRSASIGRGIVDADRLSRPQLVLNEQTDIAHAVLADKGGSCSFNPVAFDRKGTTDLAQLGITDPAGLQVPAEQLGCRGHDSTGIRDSAQSGAQVDQEPEPLLTEHALGGLMDDDEDASHVAGLGHNGAERGIPPGLFGIILSLHDPDWHVLDVSCFAVTRLRNERRGHIPDLSPDLWQGLPKCLRSDPAERETGIVVEGDQLLSPQQVGGHFGSQHVAERDAE